MSTILEKLDSIRMDALKEVGNIGAGHAMTALATMVDHRVDMSVPSVGVVTLNEFVQLAGGPEANSVGVYLPVAGDVVGHVAYMLPERNALNLVERLLGTAYESVFEFGEMECSALMEMGNILTSSYVCAICAMTGLDLQTCPPALAIDMNAAILSAIACSVSETNDELLTIVSEMHELDRSVDGYFIFIPESESLGVILRTLHLDD